MRGGHVASIPIWQREGFTTRNQYRSFLARQQINPETGKHFTSYRQLRDVSARAKGRPRNLAREREAANRLARRRGFDNANQRRSAAYWAKKWGYSLAQINEMRRENTHHWIEIRHTANEYKKRKQRWNFPVRMHEYREPKNVSAEHLIGYIVTYWHSFIDPEHDWNSKRDPDGSWPQTLAKIPGGYAFVHGGDPYWKAYLVKYAHYYSADEYDSRYADVVLDVHNGIMAME